MSDSQFHFSLMLKLHKPLLFTLLAAACIALSGCKNTKQPDGAASTFESYVTLTDTLAVQELVNRFLFYVDQGDYDNAAAMLYKHNPSRLETPEALDNEEMQSVVSMLRSLQPVGHRVDYIKFNETNHNEVRVTLILREATSEAPEVATSLTFNPVDAVDVWYLCLYDLSTGERSIIGASERDSMRERYSQHLAARDSMVASTTGR